MHSREPGQGGLGGVFMGGHDFKAIMFEWEEEGGTVRIERYMNTDAGTYWTVLARPPDEEEFSIYVRRPDGREGLAYRNSAADDVTNGNTIAWPWKIVDQIVRDIGWARRVDR